MANDLTLGTDDQTTTLLRALVDGLDDVDQLLLVLQYPIQLVVVTRSKITHHVFIAVEEHDRHRIVELVHGVEIGDLVDVAQVDDGEVCGTAGVSGWLSDSGKETHSSPARRSCKGLHPDEYLVEGVISVATSGEKCR